MASLHKQFIVTEDNVKKLNALAATATEGVSVTEVVRLAIDAYSGIEDDAELERFVDMMTENLSEVTKEVRAACKRVRKANLDYSKQRV